MTSVSTNQSSTEIRKTPFAGCEKHSRLLLGSDSSCHSLQVGTGSHDHQQQHQQTHLLLSWVMLQKPRCLTTLGFYLWIKDKDRLDLDWNLFSTFFKWTHSFLTKTSFLGHHRLSLVEGYFNSWDAGVVTETVDTCSLCSLSKSNQPFDNHRLLILSTGRDENFSQRSWELTSLLRMQFWCHTRQISRQRQMWTFYSRYKDTNIVTSLYISQLLCQTIMSTYG